MQELARRTGPAAIPVLRAAVADDDEHTAMVAIEALGSHRAAEATPDLVALLRPDRPRGVRTSAVVALQRIGDRTVQPALVHGTRHADPFVRRRAAVLALAELGDADAIRRSRRCSATPPCPWPARRAIGGA